VLQFYLSLNLILLGYVGSPEDTGQYAVASRLPSALVLLGMVWGSVLYPHVARADRADLVDLARDLGRATTLTLGAGTLLVTGAGVFAVPLMTTLFGGAYRSAAAAFAVLSAAAILLIADVTLGSTLLARGGEKAYSLAICLGVVVTAGLGAFLIPLVGAVGAAAATLAAETGIFAFYVNRVSRQIGPIPVAWSLIARCAATCAAAGAAVLLVDPGPLPVRVGLFAGAILACALLVGLGRRPVWQSAWRGS
jgi:O-antigen/teichoic acid export membrane protein